MFMEYKKEKKVLIKADREIKIKMGADMVRKRETTD